MPHLDDLVRDSQRPDVPEGERWDMNAEAFNGFVKQLQLPNESDREEAVEHLLGEDFEKSIQTLNDRFVFTTQGSSRRLEVDDKRQKDGQHKAILEVNEYGVVYGSTGESHRWLERSSAAFDFLKSFVNSFDLAKAIMLTRIRQISPFLAKPRKKGQIGFQIVRADREKLSDRDKPAVKRVEEFLLNGGDEPVWHKRDKLRRRDLAEFVSELLWSTLSADACPIEPVYQNNGKLCGWHNIPYDTIRLCTELGYEGDDEIRAVQVIDSMPYATFGYPDLIYKIRNPRSDLYAGGYGFSEPEMIIRAATNYINAVTYNAAGLDRNAIPRGILTIFGEYGPRQASQFRQQFRAMMTGAANRWTLPVMFARKKEAGHVYTPIDTNFNDMYFARWMVFLVSICSAVYGVDPTEIHFDSFSTRSQSLAGSNTEERLTSSRDKGLVPLLTFVEKILSLLVSMIDDEYALQFVGLQEDDPKVLADRLKETSTLDELRDADGRDPHPDPDFGAAPANPALMQLYMLKKQQEVQPQQQPGMEGQDQGGFGQDQQRGQDEDEDYPQDDKGGHAPYRAGEDGVQPPEDDHFHTLDLSDEDEEVRKAFDVLRAPATMLKAGATKAPPFIAVVVKPA